MVELTEMAIIDFSDYNILKASFFDIYLNVSALPVDTEQENKLRMAIMDTFDVTSTNNSLDIIFNGVSINPVTPEPRRAATANEVIIRVYTELQDKSNPGIITFSLNSDFSDHLNNEIISEWNFQIKKN
jgi:hypothetical protein